MTIRTLWMTAALISGCGGEDAKGTCTVGAEGCACTAGGACDEGLTCASDLCVDVGGDADADTDSDADGDADSDADTDADSDADADSDSDRATCGDYCAEVLGNCVDPSDQYPEGGPEAICAAVCPFFDPGEPGESSGDTLECRVSHASPLAYDAPTECPAAGPYGGGVCGESQCAVFCRLMQLICTGGNQQYDSEAACRLDCDALPDADDPFVFDGTARGSSLSCRGHRLTVAALADDIQATHCEAAAGIGFCNPSTE